MPVDALGAYTPELPPAGEYWIAPTAAVIGRVVMKPQSSIWYGATLRGDNDPLIVGARSNIQDGSVLHTDAGSPVIVGDDVTVGHNVILHSCEIGDNSLIGMGATLLSRCRIGRNCLIGANSLVTEGKIIPDGSLVVGSPARVIRPLTEVEIERITASAAGYVANWRRHAAELSAL